MSTKKSTEISNRHSAEVDIPEEQEIIDDLKKLNPEERKEIMARMRISSTHYSGPIPSPDLLKRFEEVCPGSADRIITMAEKQSEHRRNMETKVVDSQVRDSKRGMIFGFIISVVGIIGGLFLIAMDKGTAGLTLVCGILIGLVALFIYGSESEKDERIKKNKKLQNTKNDE
ncbi:hypothetical protein EA74_00454 [Enterococcus hirae]|uniref:DUF2335 domain-containing protein n=1 Tax=Enterococcus hirae TaxID=1354 RepID=A0AB37I8X4_ENTHR|nr:DUF2335 domain-containing protein [Enterococcus hirae]PCE10087.1 hypothetical protein CKY13_00060 [Enterococcus hirae]RBT56797.1 hypothetical protein EA74_00454 [Enterococcus hirae]RBT66551.1 hypothetical protein EA82_02692 [Enterococcus hirae]RBT67526.1 hypothetical protein EB03_02293 [Enterococcus hirae]